MRILSLVVALAFSPLAACSSGSSAPAKAVRTSSFERRAGIGAVVNYSPADRGWVVTSVWPGSPAAQAGIQKGDILESFDGLELPKSDAVGAFAAKKECEIKPSEKAPEISQFDDLLSHLRDGEILQVKIRNSQSVRTEWIRAVALTRAIADAEHAQSGWSPLDASCWGCGKGWCWAVTDGYTYCDPCMDPTCRTV